MADLITDLKQWINNETITARDYVYERNTIVNTVNEIIGEVNSNTSQVPRITTLETEMDAAEGRLTTNESDIDAAEARLTTNEGEIDALQSEQSSQGTRIGTLETEMNSAEGRLDSIESVNTAQQSTLGTHDTEITNLQNDKVDKTTTIAGVDLQNSISLTELKQAIGNATVSLDGLLSASDKVKLNGLVALVENEAGDDVNTIVDTIGEVLEVFNNYPEATTVAEALAGKVDKVTGKGLSENDFTTAFKDKLEDIDDGAQVNVQSDWNETDSNVDSFIQNKPSIYTQLEIQKFFDGTSPILGYNKEAWDSPVIDGGTFVDEQ